MARANKRRPGYVGGALRVFSAVTGAMSLVALLWKGFKVGFGPTSLVILKYYEKLISKLFEWAEPSLKTWLAGLKAFIGIDAHLYPHWKHVLVLLLLYVGACVKSTWSEYEGSRWMAAFVAVWGGALALLASIASGTVPLDGANADLNIAIFPIAAVCVFEFGLTAADPVYFRNEGFRFSIIGAALLVLGSYAHNIPLLAEIPNVGLAVLVAFILILGVYWIVYGANDPQAVGQTRWERFMSAAATQLGLIMFSTVLGAFVFIVLNAGLGLIGL